MIQIKSNLLRDLSAIAANHCTQLTPVILSKLKVCSTRQRNFITNNLSTILTGSPQQLMDIHHDFKIFCRAKGVGKLKAPNSKLSKVFNYREFADKKASTYCAYDLSARLVFNTCPYCNRGYNVTVTNGKARVVRPDFDHFFSQSRYPLLALSFYNLIPCCLVCNRTLKHKAELIYGRSIHPYEEGFDTAFKFNILAKDADSAVGHKTNFWLQPVYDTLQPFKTVRCKRNVELFKLTEIYEQSHGGEIADIYRKHYATNGEYLKGLAKSFPAMGAADDLYRLAFGTFYLPDDFERRPLSKLTRDVTDGLSILAPPPRTIK